MENIVYSENWSFDQNRFHDHLKIISAVSNEFSGNGRDFHID